VSPAATDAATSPPVAMNVEEPDAEPGAVQNAVTDGEKKVRHNRAPDAAAGDRDLDSGQGRDRVSVAAAGGQDQAGATERGPERRAVAPTAARTARRSGSHQHVQDEAPPIASPRRPRG